MNSSPRFIVVAGTSAGGLPALKQLVGSLSTDADVAYIIVMHLSSNPVSNVLYEGVQKQTKLTVKIAKDGMAIEKNHVYIAPHNTHLIVKKDFLKLGYGPRENRWRPSIDALFRSAAVAYNAHTIGIVLTGLLNDGVNGLKAIQRCGGTTMVQDPDEAAFPDMPMNVLEQMEVDHNVRIAAMNDIIQQVIQRDIPAVTPPESLQLEAQISEKTAIGSGIVSKLGPQTALACPDCGGSLWEVRDENVTHYRCHIGHSYSEKDLLLKQSESLESALWIAVRITEEKRNLLSQLHEKAMSRGFLKSAASYKESEHELGNTIDVLKQLLFKLEKRESSDSDADRNN
jgi:two-component system, chemotaxis family, protein-glutamate methylesterase/glutaminase